MLGGSTYNYAKKKSRGLSPSRGAHGIKQPCEDVCATFQESGLCEVIGSRAERALRPAEVMASKTRWRKTSCIVSFSLPLASSFLRFAMLRSYLLNKRTPLLFALPSTATLAARAFFFHKTQHYKLKQQWLSSYTMNALNSKVCTFVCS